MASRRSVRVCCPSYSLIPAVFCFDSSSDGPHSWSLSATDASCDVGTFWSAVFFSAAACHYHSRRSSIFDCTFAARRRRGSAAACAVEFPSVRLLVTRVRCGKFRNGLYRQHAAYPLRLDRHDMGWGFPAAFWLPLLSGYSPSPSYQQLLLIRRSGLMSSSCTSPVSSTCMVYMYLWHRHHQFYFIEIQNFFLVPADPGLFWKEKKQRLKRLCSRFLAGGLIGGWTHQWRTALAHGRRPPPTHCLFRRRLVAGHQRQVVTTSLTN